MRELTYLDFDLLVEPAGEGAYRVRVLDSPAAETPPARFTMTLSDLEVQNLLLKIVRRRGQVRGENSVNTSALRGRSVKVLSLRKTPGGSVENAACALLHATATVRAPAALDPAPPGAAGCDSCGNVRLPGLNIDIVAPANSGGERTDRG